MRTTTVNMEWAEVRRNGRKVEDWTYVVTFYQDGAFIDEHCIKTASDAGMMATMYELGFTGQSEYDGVIPGNAFAY